LNRVAPNVLNLEPPLALNGWNDWNRLRYLKVVFDAIRQLMTPPQPKKRKIGFLIEEKGAAYGRR
jgi:hypothetical protein